IRYTHRQLLVAGGALLEALPQLTAGDRTLCWLPLAHLYQRMLNLMAIARGLTLYIVENPREVVDCARAVNPAFLAAVPRFYEKLSRLMAAQPDDGRFVLGHSIKFLITGAAPAAPWLLDFFHKHGLPLLEMYGVSENTVPIAANRLDSWRPGSV